MVTALATPEYPEITMQQFSLEGISETIDDVHLLTEHILRFASVSDRDSVSRLGPLFCHCLYQSILEEENAIAVSADEAMT